jgi:hypothetical protein
MAMFSALKLSAAALYGGMSNAEKAATVRRFTDEAEPMILVGSMKGMSVGYNLQAQCHWAAFMDPPPSQPLGDSAAARAHRLGQTEPVEVVIMTVPQTFNDRQIQNNLRKAIPNVMAMMDRTIFGAEVGGGEATEEEELHVGRWVNYQGRLVPADEPGVAGLNLPVLEGMDLVKQILYNKMGHQVIDVEYQPGTAFPENSPGAITNEDAHATDATMVENVEEEQEETSSSGTSNEESEDDEEREVGETGEGGELDWFEGFEDE